MTGAGEPFRSATKTPSRVALGCFLFCMGASRLGFAQPAASDSVSAQVFFERGREADARGDAQAACDNFEESLRLEVAAGTLFNLAHCETALLRLANAWQHMREGIERLPPNDPRRKDATATANILDRRVPRLQITLRGPGEVSRDGIVLTRLSLGTPLPLNPGVHSVLVRAENHEDARFELDLKEGEAKVLEVSAGLLRQPVASSRVGPVVDPAGAFSAGKPLPVAPTTRSSAFVPLTWTLGGLGALSAATGLVTGGLSFERAQVVKRECDTNNLCSDRGLDALSASKTFGGVATVTLVAGGALLASAFVTWLLTPKHEPKIERPHTPEAPTPEARPVFRDALPNETGRTMAPIVPITLETPAVEVKPPSAWPEDVPIYPARLTIARVTKDEPAGKNLSIELSSSDSPDAIHAFYEAALTKAGWAKTKAGPPLELTRGQAVSALYTRDSSSHQVILMTISDTMTGVHRVTLQYLYLAELSVRPPPPVPRRPKKP
jgi:hypothetical protein